MKKKRKSVASKQDIAEKRKKKERVANIAVTITILVLIAVVLTVFLIVRSKQKDNDKEEENLPLTYMEEKETSDFRYLIYDNIIAITGYKGNSEVVHIPDKIDGMTVLYVWTAFLGNTSVKEVYIPSTVKELVAGTFTDCSSLQKVSFYAGIEQIDKDVFKGCSSLTTVEFYGTEDDFNNIKILPGNTDLTRNSITYRPSPTE